MPSNPIRSWLEAMDEPAAGQANQHYEIYLKGVDHAAKAASLRFQKGSFTEDGPNGITNEALLAVLIDRLQGFQKGSLSCRENAIALTNLETALLWLKERKRDRQARGVTGTQQK